MGIMGEPLSVLKSMPVGVWTSYSGRGVLKKAGLPQPGDGAERDDVCVAEGAVRRKRALLQDAINPPQS